MNVKLFTFELKWNNITGLVFVQILREDICPLGMSLTPFLSLSIEKLKTEYAFSELIHNIYPEHSIDFMSFKFKQTINFRKLAQEVSACISATLLETCRYRTKFTVPSFAFFIATLEFRISDWIDKSRGFSICSSINQFTSAMSKELVTSNMNLITA